MVKRASRVTAGLSLGFLIAGSPLTASAQDSWIIAHDEGAFVTMLGADTIAIEQFMVHGPTLQTTVVTRSPRTMTRTLKIEWNDDGTVRSAETTMDGETRPMTLGSEPSHVVFAPPLVSPYVVLARIAAATGAPTVAMGSQMGAMALAVSRPESRWVAFVHPELGTIRVRIDDQLRAQEIDTRASTLGSHALRVPSLDIATWAAEFAARDAAGRGLGLLSPPDTVRTQLGDANLTIAYYRPSARGRVIFGGVVPWGRVWRTGANEATGFTTDRDLLIGGTPVPAGSYTIWSLPTEDSWHLILNRQTGQWGTQYNAERDLAHIPMVVETLDSPVDQFTIAVGEDGVLSFAWGTRRGTVPVVVAP